MTDRELLELAAKAAGIEGKYNGIVEEFYLCEGEIDPAGQGRRWWNPLTDDGDALRLAVKLDCYPNRTTQCRLAHSDDPYAATRRAIVRAAAEIGKELK